MIMLWFTNQAFTILEQVVTLFMSLIGKIISSIVMILLENPKQLQALTVLYN